MTEAPVISEQSILSWKGHNYLIDSFIENNEMNNPDETLRVRKYHIGIKASNSK